MAKKLSKADLILQILENQEESDLEDEEIMHLLLDEKMTKNTVTEQREKQTFPGKAADGIAKFVGSWTFIICFIFVLIGWIVMNTIMAKNAVDPYPYILLNLVLSCVAAIQAPIIMMSQNRQEEKDRIRALNDYKTNLKTEIIIEELYKKIEILTNNQEKIITEFRASKKESAHQNKQ